MIIGLLHRAIRRALVRRGAQSTFFNTPECALHVLVSAPERPATTILLIHGLGTSSSTWIHVVPFLGTVHRVHAVDLPGFGMSRLKAGHRFFTLDQHTDILLEYIRANIRGPFTIIGHSMGGWLGMRLALLHPDAVHQLVLINSAGIYYSGMERQRDVYQIESRHDVRRLIDLMWHRYPWYARPPIGWIYREMKRLHVPEFVRTVTHEDFFNEDLRKLDVPVTIIWGREDRLVSPEVPVILERELSRASLYYIDECGHVPQLEKPKECLEILRRTLTP